MAIATEDIKLDLYNAVETALLEITEFKHVRKYNSQDIHIADDISRNYPKLFIYYPSIEWSPPMLQGGNTGLTNEQKGVINIGIKISLYNLKDNEETFKPHLALIAKVYRKLALLQGDNFSPLYRISETDDIDQNNVRVWEIIFSTMATEVGVSKNEVDAAPVTLVVGTNFDGG